MRFSEDLFGREDLLAGVDGVEHDARGRPAYDGRTTEEAFGVARKCSSQRILAPRSDDVDATEEDVGRREEVESFVVMVVVVPPEEVDAPPSPMSRIAEATGIVGLVFQRMELRFGERVVIRDARARVAAVDAELAQ